MITAVIKEVQGKYVVTFVVNVERMPYANLEFYATCVKDSYKDAESWAILQYKKWLQKEITNFCNQRKKAFQQVGPLSIAAHGLFDLLVTIKSQSSLTKTCLFITQHQDKLKSIVPGPTSSQYYWHFVMEAIFKASHEYLCFNQKLIKP